MGDVDGDAPPGPDLAERLSAPLAGADDAVNAVHDRLNAAVPWLWTPLAVPRPEQRLGPSHHALYAAHAALGLALLRRRRTFGVVLAVASWAVFTGAWNRRADQAASAARRAR